MHVAVDIEHPETSYKMVKILMENGADPDIADKAGFTAKMINGMPFERFIENRTIAEKAYFKTDLRAALEQIRDEHQIAILGAESVSSVKAQAVETPPGLSTASQDKLYKEIFGA